MKRNTTLCIAFSLFLVCLAPLTLGQETAPEELIIISHSVHKSISESGVNLIDLFKTATGVGEVEWRTFGLGDILDTLFRESSLPTTEIDVGFVLERAMTPRVSSLFEPLDDYMASDPVENFEDFFPGMIETITLGGKLYGIPIRSVVNVLHYNKAIFEERGVTDPPTTIEELIELAEDLTFTRDNGEKVCGFSFQGAESVIYGAVLALARAWDGDFITPDYEVVIDQEPVIKAVTILRDWWEAGVLPAAFNVMNVTDQRDLYKNNRAAMTYAPAANYAEFNDPERSLIAGNSEIIPLPPSLELAGELPMAPPTTTFWLMVIPQGAQNKEWSWRFIKYLSSPEAMVQMTFNGNDATRASVFEDPRVTSKLAYAAVAKEGSIYARPIWPPFDSQAEAQDILGREVHNAIFGGKDPAEAMQDAAEALRALLAGLGL